MSSQDMTITYKAIQDRAESDAREAMPDLPKLPDPSDFTDETDWSQHCYEEWESFQQAVEDQDALEIAHESCGWDWVIYYHKAMELCQAVPSDVLSDAESEFDDMGGPNGMGDSVGLYELAFHLAVIIVTREIVEAVERIKDELIDLAETQLENL